MKVQSLHFGGLRFFFDSFMTGGPYHTETSPSLQSKSMDWFLYDRHLHHERSNVLTK